VSVASRGVDRAEEANRGILGEAHEAHPHCDGKCAEGYEKEGVAGEPACRVCRVGAGFGCEGRCCGACCARAGSWEVEDVEEVKKLKGIKEAGEGGILSGVSELRDFGGTNTKKDSMDVYYCQGLLLSVYHSNVRRGSGVD